MVTLLGSAAGDKSQGEAARVAAVRALGLLDTQPEERFDRITRLAALICSTRMALIALIDGDRVWCKSTVGLPRICIPREHAICAIADTPGEVLTIGDASQLPETANNPLVTEAPAIRFFAAVPLFSPEGYRLGSLSVFDTQPRPGLLTEDQRQGLRDLAVMATDALGPHLLIERLAAERDALLAYFQTVIMAAPLPLMVIVPDGTVRQWNQAAERVFGWPAEEVIGRFGPHCGTTYLAEGRALIARVAAGERIQAFETQRLCKDGRCISVSWSAAPFRDQSGAIIGAVVMIEDISARKETEEKLREKTAFFEALVEGSPDVLLVVDRDRRKILQNRRAAEFLKLPPDIAADPDARRQLEFTMRRAVDPAAFLARINWLYAHPQETCRDVVELIDGTVHERYSGPVLDAKGHYYGRIWAFRDITERRRAEEHIRYLATHDELTDLPNRRLIRDQIEQALAQARRSGCRVAVLYINLDRFKVVNDGYGYPFGNAVLRAVGARIAALLRDGDAVARLSGDEFLLLLPGLRRAADASIVAGRILEALAAPLLVAEREVFLSASIGASLFPQDGETIDALVSSATAAMYRAKAQGRNGLQFFTREMHETVQRRVRLEMKLRLAIAARQFRLVYQPKVNLATGRITGAEALIRWQDPEYGAVSPTEFIPIAEDSGLIGPIGDWVLQAACGQARAWLDAGLPPVCVAVNISVRQFLQQDVVDWVTRTLERAALPARCLELELTEGLIAQDVDKVIVTFRQLSAAGVKLSIDDFGSGYSSLGYLKHFPVDTLKIDQSFVSGMLTNPDDAAIVRATIALAHTLGFKVTAEGVETEGHCRFLREQGCDEIQGFYFSTPVPAEEFEAMLRDGRCLDS